MSNIIFVCFIRCNQNFKFIVLDINRKMQHCLQILVIKTGKRKWWSIWTYKWLEVGSLSTITLILLGKSAMLPIAIALSRSSVCVCLCVCKKESWAQVKSWRKSKIKKNDVYRFWHLQSACDIASVVLADIYKLFQGQIFQKSISRKRWELTQNATDDICIYKYLPSNGIIAIVVLFDLYRFFQGQIFQMSISRKRWELSQNYKRRHL